MNVIELATSRYTTKAFDSSKKLSAAAVQQVKDLLRLSPSSTNAQPWHFILASTGEGKARVATAASGFYVFNQAKILAASHVVVFCAKTGIDDRYLRALLEKESRDGRFNTPQTMEGQHAGRSYFVNLHRYDLKDTQHWMEKQVYLNVGSFLLGVAALNIDATPLEGFDARVLDEEFGLRDKGFTSVVIVALGYRSADDFNARLPKSRLDFSQILTEC